MKKKTWFIMKNKTIFTGVLILALFVMLCGCGKSGDIKPEDTGAKTEDTTQVPENTVEADASKEENEEAQDISDNEEKNAEEPEETDETGSEEPEDDSALRGYPLYV